MYKSDIKLQNQIMGKVSLNNTFLLADLTPVKDILGSSSSTSSCSSSSRTSRDLPELQRKVNRFSNLLS